MSRGCCWPHDSAHCGIEEPSALCERSGAPRAAIDSSRVARSIATRSLPSGRFTREVRGGGARPLFY